MEKNAKAMWDDAKNSMPSMDDGGGDGVKKTINKKWSEGVDSVRKLFS